MTAKIKRLNASIHCPKFITKTITTNQGHYN